MIIHPDTEVFSGGRTSEFPGRHLLSGLDNKRTVQATAMDGVGAASRATTRHGTGATLDHLPSHEPRALSDRRFRDLARLRHASAYREAGHPRVPRDSHAITGW